MAKNATSFQPGTSGNPGGRPKRIRTLARLIDSMGDESCAGEADDNRTTMIRRLWEAAATGRMNVGTSSRELKAEQWIHLVEWLIKHMDNAAIVQWSHEGSKQARTDSGLDVADETGEDKFATWRQFVEAALQESGYAEDEHLLAERVEVP